MLLRLATGVFAVSAMMMAIVSSTVTAEDTSGGVSWTVYHSWNPKQEFTRRGTISWNKDNAVEEDKKKDASSSVLQIVNDETTTTFSSKDIEEMLNYGWYHVKIVSSDDDDEDYILQTVPACNVRRANFKDQFDLTIPRSSSSKTNKITSFAYTPLVSPLAPKSCDEYPELEKDVTKSFVSKVTVGLDTPGLPLQAVLQQTKPPPGLKFIKRPATPKSKTAGAGGEDKGGSAEYVLDDDPEDEEAKPQPTSPFAFLQKYWYVILPMVLMQFMSAPPEPEQQGGAQGAQGQPAVAGDGAGAAPAVAAAAPSGGGSGKKSRRGKKG